MSEHELLSVVIPTYYRNQRLAAAIRSVLGQAYRPVEIIVVDGSEEEHARPVSERFGVTYLAQENDSGPHAARSIGAEQASGQYIQFLDDDDRVCNDKFQKQVDLLRDRPEVGVVYGGLRWEGEDPELPREGASGDVLEQALAWQLYPSQMSTRLIEREVIEEILPFRNRHGADDDGMQIELALRTQFDYVDECVVVRGDPEYHYGGTFENLTGQLEIIRMYDTLYRDRPELRAELLSQTYRDRALWLLDRRLWSATAILEYLRSLRARQERRPQHVAQLLAICAGRPGQRLASTLWRRLGMTDE